MRSTSVTYTCDRCLEKTPEQRTGWYPRGWNKVTVFSIERNIATAENKELCEKCSNELNRWLYPYAAEELIEESKDASA